jgi:hypothetical protein
VKIATGARTPELIRRYEGLSRLAHRALWGLLALELVLIVAAECDIHTRPPESIRGPKFLWRAVASQNVIGPAAYFELERRSTS